MTFLWGHSKKDLVFMCFWSDEAISVHIRTCLSALSCANPIVCSATHRLLRKFPPRRCKLWNSFLRVFLPIPMLFTYSSCSANSKSSEVPSRRCELRIRVFFDFCPCERRIRIFFLLIFEFKVYDFSVLDCVLAFANSPPQCENFETDELIVSASQIQMFEKTM